MAAVLVALATASICITTTARAAEPLFGFNNHSVGQGLVTPTEAADKLAAGGANIMRTTVGWKWIEPKPRDYRFSTLDAIYQAALDRGVRSIFQVMWAPAWARDPSTPCADS